MSDFPIMLKIAGRKCVVIGGGEVAARRVRSLVEAGATVVVVAPDFSPQILSATDQVTRVARTYEPGELRRNHADAALVIVATDDAAVNANVQAEARALGILVNRADDPEAGDFTVPAHAHHGPVTLAVHSGGISAAAAGTMRRQLSAALDPDWPRLLTAASQHRATIQQRFADPAQRRERLRQLTDEKAMQTLKAQGIDALRAYHGKLTTP